MTESILSEASDTEIIAAMEANLYAYATTYFAKWPLLEVHDDPTLLWTQCEVAQPSFNGLHRALFESQNPDEAVADIQARYAARGLPMMWWTGPSTLPEDLGRHLIAHGFAPAGESAGMVANAQDYENHAKREGVQIRAIDSDEDLVVFGETMCAGFELEAETIAPMVDLTIAMGSFPEGEHIDYLCYLDGAPVATSTLFLGGGAAGIYNVSCVPEARRKGLGTAVTVAALQEAARRGYYYAMLQASAEAYTMYSQLGFKTYCYFHHYLWKPPSPRRPS